MSRRDPDLEARLSEALDLVKSVFPDTGIILLTAQTQGDGMNVNSASNISRKGQLVLMLDVTANFVTNFAMEQAGESETHH